MEFSRSEARQGDLIFTCWGTIDQVGLIDHRAKYDRYIVSNKQMLLTPDSSKADSLYLYYLFGSPSVRERIVNQAIGSSVPGFNLGQLRSFVINLPPISVQKAITSILGTLDDKIELNRRMNETLEAMARELFQSWFVDFEPVRAKVDGRAPAGLDPAVADLFPSHFEHGEHGVTPVGWKVMDIRDICSINSWALGKNDPFETIEYIEISEVDRGNIGTIAVYERGQEPSRARRRLRHGDTVISTVRPDRGSHFLALNPPLNRIVSTGFTVLTPKTLPWSLVYTATTQPDVSDYLGHMADGGAYPAVRPEVIGKIQVALPVNTEILDTFHTFCAPLFEMAESNRTLTRTLTKLRDTLLPKLLSGELSVAHLESKVEAVV